jgi:heat shock protein beta
MALDLTPDEEKEQQELLTEKFQPLLDWLKAEAKDAVRDGAISLVTGTQCRSLTP